MNSKVTGLESLIEGFKLSCQTEGKSPRTTEWYYTFLNRFCRFLKQNSLTIEAQNITKDHVKQFIRYLQTDATALRTGRPLSGATIQGYVRTLKAFFSWATREEYIQVNLMAGIPIPKAIAKVVNTFSSDQLTRCWQSA